MKKPPSKAPAAPAPIVPEPVALVLVRHAEDPREQTILEFTVLTDDTDRVVGLLNCGLSARYIIKRAVP